MDQSVLEPIEAGTGSTARWMVVIYNNEINTLDEVIAILLDATGCTAEEAAIETWEAHTFGKASVHFASRNECEQVATMITSIGIRTDVSPEWE
jgi:ATP-dependent Clp protease adaptor protein ClpS